jgi:hypothetical protein
VLESFQDMDIKVLADAPPDDSGSELEAEDKDKEATDETAEGATAAGAPGESSDPVRLYLREMGNFELLSREQEVDIAKRIEAGENDVEKKVLRSPVTLDLLIEMGPTRVEAGEADLRDLFEENEEPAEMDEERGREADEKQLKQLSVATAKLRSLRALIAGFEKMLKELHNPIPKGKIKSRFHVAKRAAPANCVVSSFRAISGTASSWRCVAYFRRRAIRRR